ncbi:pentatricopeptide repeat-containing protein At1g05600-like [Lotus japonicus]|uniref:pentatricopeptide repeat-containing protein At1g05600-like n=1 Tax=Lotus japonicus TaxID=34305 RepID=UPI00258DD819|nr:pentatricopeptide repeat-containing protein At1g05600-like [Lotus japonicus]
MREDSCECKDSVFVSAIKIYAKAGLVDEAISLFKNIPQFNCVSCWTESFNTLLQIMMDCKLMPCSKRVTMDRVVDQASQYRGRERRR